ncbi:unnamed protein product, partial [Ectocarpus sp. 6 AP-2014]
MQYYQNTVVVEYVKNLVWETVPRCYGDTGIREVAAKAGMQTAIQRMRARADQTERKVLQHADRFPKPFSFASVQSLVATQNRWMVKEELVAKLGIVDSARLEEVLPVQRGPGQRAMVSHVLTAAMMSTNIKGSDIRAVADGKSGDGSVVEPVDFSDDAADQRWQAELQRARQESDLERAREEAETKALISVTEHWMSDVSVHAAGTGRSTWWSADEPPPPLLSDSDSFCSCDDDDGGDDDSWLFGANVAGGAHAAARGGRAKDASLATTGVLGEADRIDRDGGVKRGPPADKRGKASRKVAAVSAMASAQGAAAPPPSVRDVAAIAEPRAITTDAGATGASGAMGASSASSAAGADMERWPSIKRWVEGVAEGWMVPRREQLWHYFRGRIDGAVIADILMHHENNARATVIACAGMLDPPIAVTLSQSRAGASAASIGGGGAGGEAGRRGNNDNDVDESDISAIVSRANFLAETDCQDEDRLQALLDKAKGKEGINPVRKKLRKAIKALADELVANGCQDTRKLTAVLQRARGKPGLDKTRKMLKKSIKALPKKGNKNDDYLFHHGDNDDSRGGKANNDNNRGKKGFDLLATSRAVDKQLNRQLKGWAAGQGKSRAKVDVLRDATNNHRTITVRGAPKNVSHAVRLLCQAIGNSVVVGEVEKRPPAASAAKPRVRFAVGGGHGDGGSDGGSDSGDGGGFDVITKTRAPVNHRKTTAAAWTTTDTTTTNYTNADNNNNNNITNICGHHTIPSNIGNAALTAAGMTMDTYPAPTERPSVSAGNNDVANPSAPSVGGACAATDPATAGASAAPAPAGTGGGDYEAVAGAGKHGAFFEGIDVPPRSTLSNTPGMQDTMDMVERLHAAGRGGQGTHRQPHQQHAAPPVAAAAPATPGVVDRNIDFSTPGRPGFATVGDSFPAHPLYPMATAPPAAHPAGIPNVGNGIGHANMAHAGYVPAFDGGGAVGAPCFADLGGVAAAGTVGVGGSIDGISAGAPPGFSRGRLGSINALPVPAEAGHSDASAMRFSTYRPSTVAHAGTGNAAGSIPTMTGHPNMTADSGVGAFAAPATRDGIYSAGDGGGGGGGGGAFPATGVNVDAGGYGFLASSAAFAQDLAPSDVAAPAAPASVYHPPSTAPVGFATPDQPALATAAEGKYGQIASGTTLQQISEQPSLRNGHISPAGEKGIAAEVAGWGEAGGAGKDDGNNGGDNRGVFSPPSWTDDDNGDGDGDGVTDGAGTGARDEAVVVAEPDPHVEAVLKAAKCERILPLLVARQINLRKLALMEYDDFKALEDENDASTRVARGPQLKIKHYSKRKMKELGVEIEPEKEEAVDDKNGGKKHAGHEGDSEGKCHVCWEKEIQVRTSSWLGGRSCAGLFFCFVLDVAAELAPFLSVFGVAPSMFLRGTPGCSADNLLPLRPRGLLRRLRKSPRGGSMSYLPCTGEGGCPRLQG